SPPMRIIAGLTLGLLTILAGCAGDGSSGAARTRTATAPDGVPIVYESRGRGEPALVFVHGWSCNRGVWREQVDVFDDSHRVIALDLGGHGESGRDRRTWPMRGLAREVVAVVEAEGLKEVILIGHSMGGPVSLFAAAEMPERTVGVIGADTLHDAEFAFSRELVESLVARMEQDF